MRLTATTILSYIECPRQAWLISRDIVPDRNNPFLELGRFIHEKYYTGIGERSIELPGIKMDLIWEQGGVTVVGEIKKSTKALQAARAQLLYYLYTLKRYGIEAEGYILVPMEKKRIKVTLGNKDVKYIENILDEVKSVVSEKLPPSVPKKPICNSCGYRELCWA